MRWEKGERGGEVKPTFLILVLANKRILYIGLRAVCKRTFCWEVKGLASGLRSVGNIVSAHIAGLSLFFFLIFHFFFLRLFFSACPVRLLVNEYRLSFCFSPVSSKNHFDAVFRGCGEKRVLTIPPSLFSPTILAIFSDISSPPSLSSSLSSSYLFLFALTFFSFQHYGVLF